MKTANDNARTMTSMETEEERARLAPEYARLRAVSESHYVGAKYDRSRPIAATAKLIRADLVAASKSAGPLRGVACKVRCSTGRGLNRDSITIEIVSVPEGMPVLTVEAIVNEIAALLDRT